MDYNYNVNSRYGYRQRNLHNHWAYVWIPIVTAFLWFATLLAMLITWLAQGRPHYPSMSPGQKVAYISDVAADILKPLFITTACITAVGFVLSLGVERWLRHEGRLLPNMRRRERVMSFLAISGALLGGAGLILLSIFDTRRHPRLHRVFLLIFMVGVALSALFTIIEYRWLNKNFNKQMRKLRLSYGAKLLIAGILIVLAIAFGATLDSKDNVAGVLEWIIAFGFTLYLLTFWYDLRQSKGIESGELGREKLLAGRQPLGVGPGDVAGAEVRQPPMVQRGF